MSMNLKFWWSFYDVTILLYEENIETTTRFLLLYRFCNTCCVCVLITKIYNKCVGYSQILCHLFVLTKEANIYFDVFQYSLGGNEKLSKKPRPKFELCSYLSKQSIFPIPNLYYVSPHSRLKTPAGDSVAKELTVKSTFFLQPF